MANLYDDIQHKVDVVSGRAEARIAQEKLDIALQQHEAREHLALSKRVRKGLAVDAKSELFPTCQALTKFEIRNYSLSRAIDYLCRVAGGGHADSTLETEISGSIADDLKQAPRGLFVPLQLRPRASGQDSNTNAAGKYLVGDQIRDLIDLLRAQTRLTTLGATWVSGLRQPASFALETSGSSASWVSENSGVDVTQQDLAFGLMNLKPKTLQATTAITRQLLQQSSVSLDARIGRDLTRAHADAIEKAAINGSGLANQPLGLLSTPNVSVIALGANGAVPSYANLCDIEEAVGKANVDGTGWLTTPSLKKVLRKVFKNGTGSESCWSGDSLLEKPGFASTAVPSTLSKGTANGTLHALIHGNFSEMIIAEWGVIDVLADPFTKKKQGLVEITSFSMCDVGIARPQSFAVATDCALS